MFLLVSKNVSVVFSQYDRLSIELEKIRIETDSKLAIESQSNLELRRTLELLMATPEFEVLTKDEHYDYQSLRGRNLNFNLINAMQHAQEGYVPTLRLLENVPWNKYFLTANNLNNAPSYRLQYDFFMDLPLFANLEHAENPLVQRPIRTYVLAQGIGGLVKMGFRNNLLDINPDNRFVEFSVPRFFSSTYKQEYAAVIQDSHGICMRTRDTSHVKILFRKDKGILRLFDIHDSERSYEPRYFFMGYHLIDNIFDYVKWAMQLSLQTRKNPLVQARIKQGMISNRELITIER